MSTLDFALKLEAGPSEFRREEISHLRAIGFTEEQILECVAVTALNSFSNTLHMGLGIVPDFEPPVLLGSPKMHLSVADARPMTGDSFVPAPAKVIEDPDADLVAKAKEGNLATLKVLIRHGSEIRISVTFLWGVSLPKKLPLC